MEDRHGELHELHGQFDSARTALLNDPEHQLEHQRVVLDAPLQPPERSTAYLDGLRGIAALFVFIQHYIGGFTLNVHEHGFAQDGNYHIASLPFLRLIWNGGNAAVAIFFVLSGFVLSVSPLRLLRNGKIDACGWSLVSAVFRRPIRLYLPPVTVALIYGLLLHVPGLVEPLPWAPPAESIWAEISGWFIDSAKFFNPFQEHGSNRGWYKYNIVAWTLPIELKGSMLVYLLILLYAYNGFGRFLTLILLSVASIVLLQFGQWAMPCFMAGLILAFFDTWSMDVAFFPRQMGKRGQTIFWHFLFIVGFYLISQPAHSGKLEYSSHTPGWGFLSSLIPAEYGEEKYYRYWQSWGSLFFVHSTLRIGWLQRFLHSRPLRYLGKVSFMLYLIHLPFNRIWGDRISRFFGQVGPGAEPSWWNNKIPIPDIGPAGLSTRFLVCLVVALTPTLILSDIGTRYIDTPSVKLGKTLARKIGLDKRGSGRKDIENGEARLPEYTVYPHVPDQETRMV